MSYELSYNDDLNDRENDNSVTVPEYWKLGPEYLYQIPPFSPLFVRGGTVIQDPTTRRIGVDGIDTVCDPSNNDYVDDEYMGIVRVSLDAETAGVEDGIDGFVVDLRYRSKLIKRPMGFCADITDSESYEAVENDKRYKTTEALAVIIYDTVTDELHLRTRPEHRVLVEQHALGLMEYVDDIRRERNHSVIHEDDKKSAENATEQAEPYQSADNPRQ